MFRSPYHHGPILNTTPTVDSISPWGPIQQTAKLADGITMVSTARHGGVHLSEERLERIPEAHRSADGWYEEDVEVGFVLFYFYDELGHLCKLNREELIRDIEMWYPEVTL